MKITGQKNRFNDEVRQFWEYNKPHCTVCGLNQPDALHHINCPSVSWFIQGDFVASIFNSAPVHNQTHPNSWSLKPKADEYHKGRFGIEKPCHIGNEAWLYTKEHAQLLMHRTARTLELCQYEPNDLDKEFVINYNFMYDRDTAPNIICKILVL